MWTENVAKAEAKNIPVGAILLASISQAIGAIGAGAIQNKWYNVPWVVKWAPTIVGAGGAALVAQTGNYIGDATAKSLAIGLGNEALAPHIGTLINKVVYPVGSPGARRVTKGTRVAGRNPGPGKSPSPIRETNLNGESAAKQLKATLN